MTPANPDLVIAAARSWLGTPYHDQASLKRVGCDCLGLARGVWREVGGGGKVKTTEYLYYATRIVFEPTGAYHKALEMRLGGDFPLVKVRRFAEAQGTKARTDRTDAHVLARMGLALDLRPQPPLPESQRVLKELHTARASLMTERIRLKCRFQQQDIPLLKRQTKALLAHVDRPRQGPGARRS